MQPPADAAAATAALPYPSHLVERWRLRDGTPVTIRPIRATDLALEQAFVRGLSPTTRYQRLLSGRKLLPGELRRLTDIDYRREMALIALGVIDGVERQLGVARYVLEAGTACRSCDFALVVADAWHGQGLGEKLLRSLLDAAVDDGIEVVTGITLSTNVAMLALARKLGFELRREPGDATVVDVRWHADAGRNATAGRAGAEWDLWIAC
jgi:GNAT superfamily N-acetyltransferase